MRTRHWLTAAGVWLALAAAAFGLPQTQVLDDFDTGAPDGSPKGWTVVVRGGTATLTHDPEPPGAIKVSYELTAPDGVVYLLGRLRLRAKPWSLETTVRGDGGGQRLGFLVRQVLADSVEEFVIPQPLTEQGWVTRNIEPKPRGGQFQTTAGGAGLQLVGLTIRRGPGSPARGALEFQELLAQVDVENAQRAMIDFVGSRYDGLYPAGADPAAELIVQSVSGERAAIEVEYEVLDAAGQRVGANRQRLEVPSGKLGRVPVRFTPPAPTGFYQVRASAKIGDSVRHATGRLAVIPEIPAEGRQNGADVVALGDPQQPYLETLIFRSLLRAGAGLARVEVLWREIEPRQGQRNWAGLDQLVAASREVGLPLVIAVAEPPTWAWAQGLEATLTGFAGFVQEVARRVSDRAVAYELWREPDRPRYWPPEPQPYAFRTLLEQVGGALKAARPEVLVVSGGLSEFTPGFAAPLYFGERYPIDHLGLAARPSRHATPYLPDDHRPSRTLAPQLAAARAWMAQTGRPYVAPWLTEVGVRTSPVDESQPGQAEELARCAALARWYGAHLFWHTAVDGQDAEDRYGLLRRNLEPKPALAALAVATAQTAGAKPLGEPATTGPQVFLYSSARGFSAVAWAEGGVAPNLPGGCALTDMWGRPLTSTRGVNGPIYATGAPLAGLLAGR